MLKLNPKETGKYVAENAKHVSINPDGIAKLGKKLVEKIKMGQIINSTFCEQKLQPNPTDPNAIDWIFVIDTLNFCFWTPKQDLTWTVNGESGYYALCAAINRAIEEKIDILNPKYYSKITKKELEHILRGDNDKKQILLLDERLDCLHQVGETLLEKFNGTFKECLKLCENSALKLLKIIIDEFPCFRDECEYKDKKVCFYKRAQILVADLWSCYQHFNGDNKTDCFELTKFNDINEITMFADYRVPQILNYYNVLDYSDELMEVLKSDKLLDNGCDFEIEIRGCSIEAIELIVEWIKKNHPKVGEAVNSILVDQYLWEHRRQINEELKSTPFHKVISIFY